MRRGLVLANNLLPERSPSPLDCLYLLIQLAGPNWTVYEEMHMGNMLTNVPAIVVANAWKTFVINSACQGECHLQRWQPDWVAISHAHKRIAIIDLCRPSDVCQDQQKGM